MAYSLVGLIIKGEKFPKVEENTPSVPIDASYQIVELVFILKLYIYYSITNRTASNQTEKMIYLSHHLKKRNEIDSR